VYVKNSMRERERVRERKMSVFSFHLMIVNHCAPVPPFNWLLVMPCYVISYCIYKYCIDCYTDVTIGDYHYD